MRRFNRRKAERIPLYSPLTIHSNNDRLSCRIVNISSTGLLVKSPFQLRKLSTVRVVFRLPTTKQRLAVDTRLIRQTKTGNIREIGMEFLNLSLQQRAAISQLVDTFSPPSERLEDKASNDNWRLTSLYREALRQLEGMK